MTVVSPSGLPAASSISGPGAYAHVFQATQSVTGNTVTVTPPAGSLTAAGEVFPVYVDPNWAGKQFSAGAAAWTQIDQGLPADHSNWDIPGSPFLQVGYCDPNNMAGCNGIGVTRTMFRFNLPSLPSNTTVNSADIHLENLWQSADCAAEPLQLWFTPGISSSSDWTNDSNWTSELEQETFSGFGHTNCPGNANNVAFGTATTATGGSAANLASSLTNAVDHHWANETFGLRAADESTTDGTAWLQWRYFQDKAADIALAFNYHYPPSQPQLSTSPGGECQGSATAPVIGNDDITIVGTIADTDGDTALTTTTTVYNSAGTAVTGAGPFTFGPAAGVTSQPLGTIHRGTLTSTGTYHFTAVTEDSFGDTSSRTCYFLLDLTAPGVPQVSGLPTTVHTGDQVAGLSFSPASNAKCTATPDPCPATYTYQIGSRPPVSVTANASGVWTQPSGSPVTIPVLGPFVFRVSGTDAAGNVSRPFVSPTITSTLPANPVPDGYFSDGSFPDLLTTDAAAADASLWLSPGTGNGKVGPAADIGGLGNGIIPNGDGPGDYNGAQLLHGDFTQDSFQDVMAYWPPTAGANSAAAAGTAIIDPGLGTSGPLPAGALPAISSSTFCDPGLEASCADAATTLVYAGNASQEGPATNNGTSTPQKKNADVIGIFGSSTTGYELALFTAQTTGNYFLDSQNGVLSDPATKDSPDGTADWQDYTLATAELPNTSNPHGDPANTVLFALDSKPGNPGSGNLYESVNPGCATGTCSTTSINSVIGTKGTWTLVTGTPAAWATSPPQLASADVNNSGGTAGAGTPEIWTITGNPATSGTATAYTITGTSPAATSEGSGSPITYPAHSWALNDGAANPSAAAPTTAVDAIKGDTAALTGSGASLRAADNSFNSVLSLDGTSYVAAAPPPQGSTTGIIPSNATGATVSVWFKTTTPDGVIISYQAKPISSGSTISSGYDPALYIGSDGKLQGDWWPAGRLASSNPVDDGLWHHAVLTDDGTSETLTLDGTTIGTSPNGSSFTYATPGYLDFGAGYLGGNWPDEPHFQQSGNTAYLTYFNGELAEITLNP
jgi:hypothetical protein